MAVSFTVSKTYPVGWDHFIILTNITLGAIVVPELYEYACTIKDFVSKKESSLGRKDYVLQVHGDGLEVWHRDSWLVWRCKGVVDKEVLDVLRRKLGEVNIAKARSKL